MTTAFIMVDFTEPITDETGRELEPGYFEAHLLNPNDFNKEVLTCRHKTADGAALDLVKKLPRGTPVEYPS